MEVRPITGPDRPWVAGLCRRYFAGETVAVLGRLYRPALLPGVVAWENEARAGALCYREEAGGAEVVLLAAEPTGRGAGTALLAAFDRLAAERGWRRLRLVTTDDRHGTLHFYEHHGWELATRHEGAVERDRALKPEIPPLGVDGRPLRDALEFHRLVPERPCR